MMELVLLVATVAQQWKLRLVANHPVVVQHSSRWVPSMACRMTAVRRNGSSAL